MVKPRSTERGLLMSGPMALAAFRGLKTQTRRPLKTQPEPGTGVGYYSTDGTRMLVDYEWFARRGVQV